MVYSLANPIQWNYPWRSRFSFTALLMLWGTWWVPMASTVAKDFVLKSLLG